MYRGDYINYIQAHPGPDAELMLRVYLNQLYDAEQYPVDLRELLSLPPDHRRIAMSFLACCAAIRGKVDDAKGQRVEELLIQQTTERGA